MEPQLKANACQIEPCPSMVFNSPTGKWREGPHTALLFHIGDIYAKSHYNEFTCSLQMTSERVIEAPVDQETHFSWFLSSRLLQITVDTCLMQCLMCSPVKVYPSHSFSLFSYNFPYSNILSISVSTIPFLSAVILLLFFHQSDMKKKVFLSLNVH